MTSSSAPNGCPRELSGCAGLVLGWQVFSDGTTHIRVECAACGAFVQYVRQTQEAIQRAGPPPAAGGWA